VGLVGGIGSGKSTIARRAAQRFGFALIDGDAAGHAALMNEVVRSQLMHRFGETIVASDGSIDRSALAARVFGATEDHAAAKIDLERIVHPLIEAVFRERIAVARRDGAAAVLLDAAVLFEAGWQGFCDVVVFVDAPFDVRRSRVADRGWSEAEWRLREDAQLSIDEKRRRANLVISNAGSLDEAVDALVAAVGEFCGGTFTQANFAVGSTA
jgi:dephospho-CoA kinase